ncbi:hypothetical protein Taro_032546 [Colocasia esculenta]|uniref:Uncharacterized protein n=1 Tax=Colocasia esculenta TaxID=4460 RepID=A0A843VZF2_COLES|nr:hypothetical protein [Colocasia esculenta]
MKALRFGAGESWERWRQGVRSSRAKLVCVLVIVRCRGWSLRGREQRCLEAYLRTQGPKVRSLLICSVAEAAVLRSNICDRDHILFLVEERRTIQKRIYWIIYEEVLRRRATASRRLPEEFRTSTEFRSTVKFVKSMFLL